MFVLLHVHHIAVDGTSISILLQDIKQLCLGNVLPGSGSGTIVAESEFELQKDFHSWVDYAKTLDFSHSFPLISSSDSPEEAGYLCVSLGDQAFNDSLQQLCKDLHVSFPALTTASLGLALCCVLQTEEIALGYVMAMITPSLQRSVGFVANTMYIIAVVSDVGTSSPLLVGYVTPQSVSTRLLTVICIIINTVLVTHFLVLVTFDR